jgi:hypothetical protein
MREEKETSKMATPRNLTKTSKIKKVLKGQVSLKRPESRRAIVEDLLKDHPTLSNADISCIMDVESSEISKYMASISRRQDQISKFNEIESLALREKLLMLLTALDASRIKAMSGLQITQAYGILSDKLTQHNIRHAMRDGVSSVVDAIRKRKGGKVSMTYKGGEVTISAESSEDEDSTNDSLMPLSTEPYDISPQAEGGVGG